MKWLPPFYPDILCQIGIWIFWINWSCLKDGVLNLLVFFFFFTAVKYNTFTISVIFKGTVGWRLQPQWCAVITIHLKNLCIPNGDSEPTGQPLPTTSSGNHVLLCVSWCFCFGTLHFMGLLSSLSLFTQKSTAWEWVYTTNTAPAKWSLESFTRLFSVTEMEGGCKNATKLQKGSHWKSRMGKMSGGFISLKACRNRKMLSAPFERFQFPIWFTLSMNKAGLRAAPFIRSLATCLSWDSYYIILISLAIPFKMLFFPPWKAWFFWNAACYICWGFFQKRLSDLQMSICHLTRLCRNGSSGNVWALPSTCKPCPGLAVNF